MIESPLLLLGYDQHNIYDCKGILLESGNVIKSMQTSQLNSAAICNCYE